MAKPKAPRTPNILDPGDDLSSLTRYQKGWKTASGEKGYLTTEYFNESELTPHKDHFHTKDGAKVFMGEGFKGDAPKITEPPTEEDVMVETVNKQRELQRRARRKMGSSFTMLQSGSGGPYSRSNKLV